jgi:hypothetical protein
MWSVARLGLGILPREPEKCAVPVHGTRDVRFVHHAGPQRQDPLVELGLGRNGPGERLVTLSNQAEIVLPHQLPPVSQAVFTSGVLGLPPKFLEGETGMKKQQQTIMESG